MTMYNLSTDVSVRELIGWDLDENVFRPPSAVQSDRIESARAIVAGRPCFQTTNPIGAETPVSVAALLKDQLLRDDLHREMDGLDWSLGVVDLRHLLAFQRRLIFDPEYPQPAAPASDAWPALTALAFGPPVSTAFTALSGTSAKLVFQSANPNMQLRPAVTGAPGPFTFHGGSPFFEVAEYRGRWFLRDGYHRAEYLLRSGITQVPAVVICARTLTELGPIGSWFFSEQILFGPHPPYVSDFLDDQLTQQYTRPRMLKTLRVTIEESFGPAASNPFTGEQT
jgi:hypothetical protein